MHIQAFIFNWTHHGKDAIALQRAISPHAPTTVISSTSGLGLPGWVEIGEDAYFTAQWNAALASFSADVLFHMQADATLDGGEYGKMFSRAEEAEELFGWGVYAPAVDYSYWSRPRGDDELSRVPNGETTDCTCWMLHRKLLELLPREWPAANKFGWGTDSIYCKKSRLRGWPVLRDYRFHVTHPPGHEGYTKKQAIESTRRLTPLKAYLQSDISWTA